MRSSIKQNALPFYKLKFKSQYIVECISFDVLLL